MAKIIRSATTVTFTDKDLSGSFDESLQTIITYNDNETVNNIRKSYDYNSDGFYDYREITAYVYDANGNITGELLTRDEGADGIVEYTFSTTRAYDTASNLLTETLVYTSIGPDDFTVTTSNTYGASGITTSVIETDYGSDGTINPGTDSRETRTYQYDANGLLAVETVLTDDDADGTPDTELRDSYVYDPNGNVVTKISQTDFGADGTLESFVVFNYTYDSLGNLLTETKKIDGDGDISTFEQIFKTTNTYFTTGQENNKLASSAVEVDVDNDGIIDFADRRDYAYTFSGNNTTLVETYSRDANGYDVITNPAEAVFTTRSVTTYFFDQVAGQDRLQSTKIETYNSAGTTIIRTELVDPTYNGAAGGPPLANQLNGSSTTINGLLYEQSTTGYTVVTIM